MANDQKPVMLFARVEEWEEWLEAHPDHPFRIRWPPFMLNPAMPQEGYQQEE